MADLLEKLRAALAGHYRVDREIGSGGMATVYLAHDLKHDRRVALKVLRPELAKAVGGDRFLREITLTAGLQHPHILPLYDSGEADGTVYYVMPFVEGESLRARLFRAIGWERSFFTSNFRTFDVSPDGQQFYLGQSRIEGHAVLVQNALAALRQ